jgi:hypothetical protein
MSRGALFTGCFLLASLTAPIAAAAPCGRPDLRAAFPGDGATEVPIDATLAAVYAETADYLAEPVELSSAGATLTLSAEFDASERRLFVRSAALEPNTTYSIHWPALRGLSSAGHGLGKTVEFATSAQTDQLAPEFGGIRRLEWDLVQVKDECTDELEPRFRFDFELAPSSDDSSRDSLALLLFQTRGRAVQDGAPRLLRQLSVPEDAKTRLDLTVGESSGHVCFAAVVRDLVGRISPTGSDEHCVVTTAPPFFYGCQMLARAPQTSGLVGYALLCVLVARRRRDWRAG